ncbi:MAG: bifunctional folylpolyglutamate synthase/dihydrofolate synthase [Bacteroidales bacterium]|nr:bifunctional folylpolyglutamate synthase/dihydrofolate synthase [Bacteroidales bacterium]
MNYRQTLDYLFAQLPMFHRIGAAAYRADLSNTINLCTLLGHPENTFKSVHIAGTNGKGSTSHLIASVLQSAGYKTGLYTSPHLKDFRERIRINGKKIPKSFVSKFVNRYRNQFEPVEASFFEYTAVMAFQYFAKEKVDVAIIETGMGGRLDSTNVITPLISVITNISKDHTAFLGETLPAIAAEKAGIIKPGVPIIIGETQPEVREVFLAKAKALKSPILFADQNFKMIRTGLRKGSFYMAASTGDSIPGDGVLLYCPLSGIYQEKNIISSFQVIKLLTESGFNIPEGAITSGYKNVIRQTGLQGRWQSLPGKPKTICDVGHNEAGIRYILEQLGQEKFDRLHWVFGLVNDKDADSILKLLPRHAVYYFCKANIPRGLEALELQQKALAYGLKGEVYQSVREAFMAARNSANSNDLVLIGGSTFVVAEVL